MISDCYQEASDPPPHWNGQWLALLDADWEKGQATWRPLLKHGSSWKSQDAHPHPILDNACGAVYYTSDRDGMRAVYRVEL